MSGKNITKINNQYDLEQLLDSASLNIISEIKKNNLDAEYDYLLLLNKTRLKREIQKLVRKKYRDRSVENTEEAEKQIKLLKEKQNEADENEIATYITIFAIKTFMDNIENNVIDINKFSPQNFFAFAIFLSDLSFLVDYPNFENYEEEKKKKELSFFLEKIIKTTFTSDIVSPALIERQDYLEDFFDLIDERAEDIFYSNLNDNASSIFAFKDLIETDRKYFFSINYNSESEKSVHCKKNFSLESIFYL